ncbi:hypothetical protein Y032_0947g3161, partial [Ancylostoma ceylanicum]
MLNFLDIIVNVPSVAFNPYPYMHFFVVIKLSCCPLRNEVVGKTWFLHPLLKAALTEIFMFEIPLNFGVIRD